MSNSLLINALQKKPVDRTPVWLMRQAGRYLPEYGRLRAKAGDFLTLCQTPAMACEVTLQPLQRFPLDAAILFSDILTIPAAMGLGLRFVEGEGPVFERPLQDLASVETHHLDHLLEKLSYVMETAQRVRAILPADIPLIGFSGCPWTLACYMVEGRSSSTYTQLLRHMYLSPDMTHRLLQWLADMIVVYLRAQIDAGCQVVMLFDTWGGLLSAARYRVFSFPGIQTILNGLKATHPEIPVIVFAKGVHAEVHASLAASGATALGLDTTVDLHQARRAFGDQVALQGNLDPALLLSSPACIEQGVKDVLAAYGKGSGHIFNLGHGVLPSVPPEHVAAMVEAVHKWSPAYHR